jgi:hypothetical protein
MIKTPAEYNWMTKSQNMPVRLAQENGFGSAELRSFLWLEKKAPQHCAPAEKSVIIMILTAAVQCF